MKIKLGDYVRTKDSLLPGMVVSMFIDKIPYNSLSEININDPRVKVIKCIVVYYKSYESRKPSRKKTYYLDEVENVPISMYGVYIRIGEELLQLLYSIYQNRCSEMYSLDEFIKSYYYNPEQIMKWIPIKQIISHDIVEFKDGSIWKCRKIRYKSSRRLSREKKKKHHIYLPIKSLYDIRNSQSI